MIEIQKVIIKSTSGYVFSRFVAKPLPICENSCQKDNETSILSLTNNRETPTKFDIKIPNNAVYKLIEVMDHYLVKVKFVYTLILI